MDYGCGPTEYPRSLMCTGFSLSSEERGIGDGGGYEGRAPKGQRKAFC